MRKPIYILALIAFIALAVWMSDRSVLGAPTVSVSTQSTSTPAANFSFTVATGTPLTSFGSTTLAVYGSTTIQTPVNTLHAFRIINAASSTVFGVDTVNASTTVAGQLNAQTLTVTSCTGCSASTLVFNPFSAASYLATSTATSTFQGGFKADFSAARVFFATSTTEASTFLGGVTITCTDCITDTNVVDALTVSGGTVNNSAIGATTAASGRFTTLYAESTLGVVGAVSFYGTLTSTSTITLSTGGIFDASGAATLKVPVSASSTITASGELELDTTDSAIHANFGGTTRSYPALVPIGFSVSSTTARDRVPLAITRDFAFVVTEVKVKMHCMATSTPIANCGGGYDFNLTHGANQNSTSTLFSVEQNTTSTSSYTAFSSFNDATIAADEEWFLTTGAASTSNHTFVGQIFGYYEP